MRQQEVRKPEEQKITFRYYVGEETLSTVTIIVPSHHGKKSHKRSTQPAEADDRYDSDVF